MTRTCPRLSVVPAPACSTTERQQLIDQHMRLVYQIAVKLFRRLRGNVELDDLVAYGTEGLYAAIDRYDSERGVPFGAFARFRIRGAMIDGVRAIAPMPLSAYRRRVAAMNGEHAHITVDVGPAQRDPARLPFTGISVVELASRAELRRRVLEAMQRLPDNQRTLIERHYFGDADLDEAGAELGYSKSWASRLHARAIDTLRGALAA